MTSSCDNGSGNAELPDSAAARRCNQLKARAERWARLCTELSSHAAELKNVRDQLRPAAPELAQRETELEKRSGVLANQEAALKRRRAKLGFLAHQYLRRRKQLLARECELDSAQRAARERHDSAKAEIESQAELCLREAESLASELDAYDAELRDALDELDRECGHLAVDPDAPPAWKHSD